MAVYLSLHFQKNFRLLLCDKKDLLSLHPIKNEGSDAFLYIDTDFKLWHRREHINQVREREETSTVSESVWHLLTVARSLPVVELKDVRSSLYLPKEDTNDNDCSLLNIKGVDSLESTPFFIPQNHDI